ncbi:hypothetical protein [Janthinobacterium lividum]|jgi:hypothetical protein|uniref:hypothetical protein n=1 Tax=Janthinobacterium lividum TaxID=29581 RepID=UPI000B19E6B0
MKKSSTGTQLTYSRGAALPDPADLFNASLDGNTRRASTCTLDTAAFKARYTPP